MRILIITALLCFVAATLSAAAAPETRISAIEVKADEEIDKAGKSHMVWRSKATASASSEFHAIIVFVAGLNAEGFQVAEIRLKGTLDPKAPAQLFGTDPVKDKEPPKVTTWKVLRMGGG